MFEFREIGILASALGFAVDVIFRRARHAVLEESISLRAPTGNGVARAEIAAADELNGAAIASDQPHNALLAIMTDRPMGSKHSEALAGQIAQIHEPHFIRVLSGKHGLNCQIMNRRNFLSLLSSGVAGIALKEAIPFNRVWSFPKKIVRPKLSVDELQGFIPTRLDIGDFVKISETWRKIENPLSGCWAVQRNIGGHIYYEILHREQIPFVITDAYIASS